MSYVKIIASVINEDPNFANTKAIPRRRLRMSPTTTPTKPTTPTRPATPKPRPTFDPFRPPRPKETPRPKGRTKRRLAEALEDEANRNVVDFWRNVRTSNHPYAKHPIMAMYGYESAQKAFASSAERAKKAFPNLRRLDMNSIGSGVSEIITQLMRIESRYQERLEDIAIDVVSSVWKIDPNMIDAQLTRNVNLDPDYDETEEEDVDVHQINKRITMNALTQGAAVHNMMTMHRLVENELNALDPRLLQAYDQLSSGSTHSYWLMDYSALPNLVNFAIGSSGVTYEDEQPLITAKAFIFPVLIQELVKGVMELLSHHGLSGLSQGQLKRVYRIADDIKGEPWLIQVGPQLWKSFLQIVPDSSRLAEVVAKVAQKDPKFIHDLLSRTIEAVHADRSTESIKQEIRELIDDIQEHEKYDDGYGEYT